MLHVIVNQWFGKLSLRIYMARKKWENVAENRNLENIMHKGWTGI
jgi:hypothetical protein